VAEKKPPGVERIAFIGDSVTLGYGVEEDDTFVRRFERIAARSRSQPSIEALNFGVDGYNAVQVGALLRLRVLPFEPDTVVYVLCPNDFDFQGASGEKIRYFRRPTSFLLQRIERIRHRFSDAQYHLYHFDRTKRRVFEEVDAMRAESEAGGARFVVVVLPTFEHSTTSFRAYPYEAMNAEIVRELAGRDVHVLDLLARLVETDRAPTGVSLDVWHPNRAGHAFIARQIYDWMALPPTSLTKHDTVRVRSFSKSEPAPSEDDAGPSTRGPRCGSRRSLPVACEPPSTTGRRR
jgi:lysophospholipase L1-like esterase